MIGGVFWDRLHLLASVVSSIGRSVDTSDLMMDWVGAGKNGVTGILARQKPSSVISKTA